MTNPITEETEAILILAHKIKKAKEAKKEKKLIGAHWGTLKHGVIKHAQRTGMGLLDPSPSDLCRFVLELGEKDLTGVFKHIGPKRAKMLFDEALDFLDESEP